MKFSSGVYGTKVFGRNMTCTEAYDELSARAGTSELASLRAKIAKMSGTTPTGRRRSSGAPWTGSASPESL